jgi:hypothetical protein
MSAQARFCGRCGTPRVSEGDLYCRSCGEPYSQPSVAAPREALPPTGEIVAIRHAENRAETAAPSSPQEFGTKWLEFWTDIYLPLNVIVGTPIALLTARSAEELLGTILVEIPLVWLAVTLIIGLRHRRLSAWQLNWLWLLIEVFTRSVTRVREQPIADKTGALALFLGAAFLYGLVWGLPNYIYFRKRRALFSGPPVVDDGIQGLLKAIGRFLWPIVTEEESARKAWREGVYAVAVIVFVQSILVTFSAFGHTLFGVTRKGWVDGALFAAIGWGIYKQSRAASVLGIIFFLVERIVRWTTGGSVQETGASVVTEVVLMLMLVNGARGTFARHRHQTTAEKAAGSLAPYSSARWEVYSTVLASFVLGFLALRVYQSLIAPGSSSRENPGSEELPELVKRVRPAVVTLLAYDSTGKPIGQGSGFFVSTRGEILTNHHVLDGASSAEIMTSDGTKHPIAAVVGDDPNSDLTEVIVISDDDTPFLPLAHQRPEAGERIVVIGSPLGLEQTVSEGIVSAIPEERQQIGEIMPATLQITAPISEGSSGGPVLDMKGEVVGVAAAYLRKGEDLNFAIPLERILTLKRSKPMTLALWSNPHRKPDARDFFTEGIASMKLDDCEQALLSFHMAVKKIPSFALAWWGTGVCFLQEGKATEAVAALKRAASLDPSLALPHYALGLTYASQGKRELAFKEYSLLKRLDPDLATKLKGSLPQ